MLLWFYFIPSVIVLIACVAMRRGFGNLSTPRRAFVNRLGKVFGIGLVWWVIGFLAAYILPLLPDAALDLSLTVFYIVYTWPGFFVVVSIQAIYLLIIVALPFLKRLAARRAARRAARPKTPKTILVHTSEGTKETLLMKLTKLVRPALTLAVVVAGLWILNGIRLELQDLNHYTGINVNVTGTVNTR